MIANKQVSEQVARMLLEIHAVQFNLQKPFKWTSGWHSPIYCDNRLTLSYPKIRTFIKDSFVNLAKQHFADAECIAGVATAGIPQGALLAEALDLPFVYVRAKPKEHGKENLIEGRVEAGKRVLIVEDVVSTGKSTLQAAQALSEAELEISGVLAIFTYGFDFVMQQFENQHLLLHTLTDYTQLLVEVFKQQDLDEKTMASLHAWRKDPQNWDGE
jgi:orotate phosphoribosyltransferase